MKNRSGKILALAVLSVGLAACAPEFNPPPDYKGGFLWNSDKSRTVVVEAGDTIYTISRRYDVPTKVIIARNGLQPPYTLTAGQSLILDPTRTHTVVRGDTLSQIAVKYRVEMRLLATANDLQPPYVIRVGQELWIPDPFTQAAAPVQVASAGEPPAPLTAQRAPRSAITSETLTPPPGSPAPPPGSVVQAPPPAVASEQAPQPLTPDQPVSQAPATTAPAEPEVALAVPPPPLTEPPPRASSRFSWPVNGKVLAGFGSAGKGLHNDGINIAAPAGTQVRAADNGVVAYAGNELKGFGNLLLIKHADGWTTAYAHNEKLLVGRGDQVKQGQVIAVVGRTGNVDSPQLHFEVRKGTQAMDPMEFLSK
jgi:murein DD-endopeptidase MepM/ murein hydrolase activator NlpD